MAQVCCVERGEWVLEHRKEQKTTLRQRRHMRCGSRGYVEVLERLEMLGCGCSRHHTIRLLVFRTDTGKLELTVKGGRRVDGIAMLRIW